MDVVSSLSREEIGGVVAILTVVVLMSWYNTDSLALHSRVLTVALSALLAGAAGIATIRWLR